MSVQFGLWNFNRRPAEHLSAVETLMDSYGPDGSGSYCDNGLSIRHGAFHTTMESRKDKQPYVSVSGAVLSWDGHLHNRVSLASRLSRTTADELSDVAIVAEAYQQWGTDSFARLIGDWALSIWNPTERSLILARDFVGTHGLYYSVEANQITWSNTLDLLIHFSGGALTLAEEYIAGWLSFFPASHLTPYQEIRAVPPSSFVRLTRGHQTTHKFWDFDCSKRIRYRSDAEYEEHFRVIFAESVRRRLRSDAPVLAELSGGMDSSSIVCVADMLIERNEAEVPQLDTISYYDDSEPSWNERPYFTKVEASRGQTGCHIDLGSEPSLVLQFRKDRLASTPASAGCVTESTRQFLGHLASRGHRVVLSGFGGDEVLGGVPTPTPLLADLLAEMRLRALARQLREWALAGRKPWFHLLLQTVQRFLPLTLTGVSDNLRPSPWLTTAFARRHRAALSGYPRRLTVLSSLPSFQDNLSALDGLRRQLGCTLQPETTPFETRYPYLDRDLLEFIFAIPREQLVRPGQRRSLMRRALIEIVPEEILNRKRKAFVARKFLAAISSEWESLTPFTNDMLSSTLGIINADAFRAALETARTGRNVPITILMRTLNLECWLRNVKYWRETPPHQALCIGSAGKAHSMA
jgi:asparagine synthase (glutamine-hydrolysing)